MSLAIRRAAKSVYKNKIFIVIGHKFRFTENSVIPECVLTVNNVLSKKNIKVRIGKNYSKIKSLGLNSAVTVGAYGEVAVYCANNNPYKLGSDKFHLKYCNGYYPVPKPSKPIPANPTWHQVWTAYGKPPLFKTVFKGRCSKEKLDGLFRDFKSDSSIIKELELVDKKELPQTILFLVDMVKDWISHSEVSL